MISYTYQILSLRKRNDTFLNNIKSFKIRVTGTEGGESHYVDDEVLLDMPTSDDFIEYQNLKKEDLVDWYSSGVGEIMAQHEVQQKFNLNKGTETNTFPWQ
jgi:hypothetical protein